MRLNKINYNGDAVPLEAMQIEKNNRKYYNIFHGDPDSWVYRCSVDKRMCDIKEDKILLNNDNYILREIRDVDKSLIKDAKGNVYYVVSKDNDTTHRDDLLLFIELSDKLMDVDITYHGFVRLIGNGYSGKNYTPCPVVEYYGDGKITITGNIDDIPQTVSYKYTHSDRILKRI